MFSAAALLTWWSLRSQFGATSFSEVRTAWGQQQAGRIILSLALTALSFAALAMYDWLGARVVAPGRVPARTTLLAGATANAISNTLGFHAVTGSLVRARIYLQAGLSGAESARIVSLSWMALGLGFLTMVTVAEFVQPDASPIFGSALALVLALLLAWLAGRPRQLRVFGFRQPLPSAPVALSQMLIGAVETAAAIGALYVLLPHDLAPPFSQFAIGCLAAVIAGLLAHAPGGIGVFEAAITALLAGAGRADLLAALLLYRAIYNLLPFVVSAIVIAVMEWSWRHRLSSREDSV